MRQYLPCNLRFAWQYTDYHAEVYEELSSGQAHAVVFTKIIFPAGIAALIVRLPGTDPPGRAPGGALG
jgi:hypothetical protein